MHSIAASLFARKDQVHFFRDIGYRHEQIQHCPMGDLWSAGRCACDPNDSFGALRRPLLTFLLIQSSLCLHPSLLALPSSSLTLTPSDYHINSCVRRFESLYA